MVELCVKLTDCSDSIVPAGIWLSLNVLAVFPVFLTVKVCLGALVNGGFNHNRMLGNSQALEMRGVVE